ncbi:U-scoloptoxin(01)-Cw1a-like 36 [Homarus americanus]|uniref:U-scoloptoxin(01)-Cw1a-like 36 n=2 Tax=Homarus americanus TaxID=6706 RepID=A0A8J5JJM5_HOMAM|nr:U-scoloptoxin(01)-Cw1a-like 36 [Homarus americanus]
MNRFVTALALALVAVGTGGQVIPGYNYGAPGNGDPLLAAASSVDDVQVDPLQVLAEAIPGGGVPGEDYPILASVPDTGFSCEQQEFPGYFADTADEAGCQVFHICQFDGRQDSFLCPNGTIFNQQYFVCDWWFNVDCAASQQFFGLNAEIGKVPEDNEAAASDRSLSTSYGAPQQQSVAAPNRLYNTPGRL